MILPCALGYKFSYIAIKVIVLIHCALYSSVTDIKLDLGRRKGEENVNYQLTALAAS